MYNENEDYNSFTEEDYFQSLFSHFPVDLVSDEDFELNKDLFADISDGFRDYDEVSGGKFPPQRAVKVLEIIISSIRKNGVY